MALTPAERQANAKAKKQELLESLSSANALLMTENTNLRAEIKTLTEKMHRMEIAALKAQLKKPS